MGEGEEMCAGVYDDDLDDEYNLDDAAIAFGIDHETLHSYIARVLGPQPRGPKTLPERLVPTGKIQL